MGFQQVGITVYFKAGAETVREAIDLLVAWLTLGEVPTMVQVVGTIMILGGIGLARLRRKPAVLPEDLLPPE